MLYQLLSARVSVQIVTQQTLNLEGPDSPTAIENKITSGCAVICLIGYT